MNVIGTPSSSSTTILPTKGKGDVRIKQQQLLAQQPLSKTNIMELEQRLKDAVNEKEITEHNIKKKQLELESLIGSISSTTTTSTNQNSIIATNTVINKYSTSNNNNIGNTSHLSQNNNSHLNKQLNTVEGIDHEIAQLELLRTINSMSLAEERTILKQIYKLNQSKRQLIEQKNQKQNIVQQKQTVSTLRNTLKEQRTDIQEMKIELSTVQTAVALNCDIKDLLGKKIDCPTDKIGTIIGKNGKNVQEIMSTNNVNVQINKEQGDIQLIGSSLESLDVVVSKLEQAMTQIDKNIDISSSLHRYLTSANITLLSELRSRHPDTIITLRRTEQDDTIENKKKQRIRNLRVRGNPADIAAFEMELSTIECIITKEIAITSRLSGMIVGKSGKNIDEMVKTHQVIIDFERPSTSSSTDVGSSTAAATTTVTICGPPANVEAVLNIINHMIDENRDVEEKISLESLSIVKIVLLQNNGVGIQSIQKMVNNDVKTNFTEDSKVLSSSILMNVRGTDLVIKGKSKAVAIAVPLVQAEIDRLSSYIVKLSIDIMSIPSIIGKGGQGIKSLLENTTSVHLEINSKIGEIEICGLQQDEVTQVVQATKEIIQKNQVRRLKLECDDSPNSTNSFSVQFRNLIRSTEAKEIKELVILASDNDTKELVLRGTPKDLDQASKLVQAFVDANFMEELVVSTEDMSALLTGGKSSKIVDLTNSTGVNLSADKDRNVIVAKGEKSKVIHAIQAVREFLYGSANVAVRNIIVADSDLMGVIIGKAGKTKADLQKKYPSVSIIVHRTDAAVTLRGDSTQVEQCNDDIMTLLIGANISRSSDLTEENLKDTNTLKYIKRLGSIANVKVEIDEVNKCVSFRGVRSDVHSALTMLKEHLTGAYECRWYIGSTLFKKFHEICSKSSHLNQMSKKSASKIYLDEKNEVIVVSGTRESVKVAKNEIITFFDFVFGATMSKYDVPSAAFPMMGKSTFINEVVGATGTTILADQDLSTVLIFSAMSEKIDKARTLFDTKLDAVEKLIFVWQFSESEDWMVSYIIGKKGENIQKLRKDSNCTIEVDSTERRMVVSSDDADTVSKGKEIIDSFVNKARNEYAVIMLSPLDTPAFIGKSGSHMKEFMDQYNVKVDVVKKGEESELRITGQAENVTIAKQGFANWLSNRVELRKDAEGETIKYVKLRDIPVIIGTKGETIRGLQREFGCKMNVDREKLTITVTGGTSKKRLALCEKMDQIIADSDTAREKLNETTSTEAAYIGDILETPQE